MHNVDFPHDIPKRWLERIKGIEAVAQADPIVIGFSDMALPNGAFEGVVVVGVDDGPSLGRVWKSSISDDNILDPDNAIIVDRFEADKLCNPQLGELREIGGRKAKIVGKSQGILSFLVTPYIFTTIDRATKYTGKDPSDCSYFLVKVHPGCDPKEVCREIESRLPFAQALTSREYADVSIHFWTTRTGIGISFGAATVLGIIVGLVMVAQTLYAMVLDRVTEYATLKAIGAKEWEIVTVLFGQSTGIALFGIGIGLVLSVLLQLLFDTPRAPINLSWSLALFSSIGIYVMCLLASALPYLRIRAVDAHSALQEIDADESPNLQGR